MLNIREYYRNTFKVANKELFIGDRCSMRNQFKIGFGTGEFYDPNSPCYFDYDIFAFMISQNGKILSDKHIVFYNSELRVLSSDLGKIVSASKVPKNYVSAPVDPELSIIGHFDECTGAIPFEMKPDDEVWDINLSKVHPEVNRIVFCAVIYDSTNRHQNFGDVPPLFTRFYYHEQQGLDTEYLYLPQEDYSSCGAIELCSINKVADGWEITPLSIGHENAESLINKYV